MFVLVITHASASHRYLVYTGKDADKNTNNFSGYLLFLVCKQTAMRVFIYVDRLIGKAKSLCLLLFMKIILTEEY